MGNPGSCHPFPCRVVVSCAALWPWHSCLRQFPVQKNQIHTFIIARLYLNDLNLNEKGVFSHPVLQTRPGLLPQPPLSNPAKGCSQPHCISDCLVFLLILLGFASALQLVLQSPASPSRQSTPSWYRSSAAMGSFVRSECCTPQPRHCKCPKVEADVTITLLHLKLCLSSALFRPPLYNNIH